MDSVSYGIGVTNRYDLFLDDETDPLEALKIIEQEKAAKKKTKLGDKENTVQQATTQAKPKTAAAKKPAPKVPAQKPQDNKVSPKGTGPKPTYDEDRNNKRNGEVKPRAGRPFDNNQTNDRPRGTSPRDNASENRRGRPLGAKNGGRVATRRPFEDRRGKREFDRQSGSDKTGVKPVDKRDGAGAHNWGSDKDVIDEANKSSEDANIEEKVESADIGDALKDAEIVPVEEEVKQLTLEEWKALRSSRSKPQYNLRKAGEGEDQTQWKKMYELNKKALADQDSDDEEYDPSEFPQRAGKMKHVKDISFFFNDNNRRGGAFRGRGGRGGRNSNRFRDDQGQNNNDDDDSYNNRSRAPPAPKVDDERAFPSLG